MMANAPAVAAVTHASNGARARAARAPSRFRTSMYPPTAVSAVPTATPSHSTIRQDAREERWAPRDNTRSGSAVDTRAAGPLALKWIWLEGYGPLHHEPLELPAIPNVGRGEVDVLLGHELALQQDGREHEPAGANLRLPDGHFVCDVEQVAVRLVVTGADVELLTVEQPVHAVDRVLLPGALAGFRVGPPGGTLQYTEH